jgi:hypothetical protein
MHRFASFLQIRMESKLKCFTFTFSMIMTAPVSVAARSKVWVYGGSPAEIVGTNPTKGMDVCLLCVLCVVRYRSLRRADHSSRDVLPTVARRCV